MHTERGLDHLADIEIRYGKKPNIVRYADIDEFQPGELLRREQQATVAGIGKSVNTKFWAENIQSMTPQDLIQKVTESENKLEELRRRLNQTLEQQSLLDMGRRNNEAIIRLENLDKRSKKFVIPWGLEDIIKPIVGYILVKTNLEIDKLERGESVPMTKPPAEYYLNLDKQN